MSPTIDQAFDTEIARAREAAAAQYDRLIAYLVERGVRPSQLALISAATDEGIAGDELDHLADEAARRLAMVVSP
jgi:hypothetical protein